MVIIMGPDIQVCEHFDHVCRGSTASHVGFLTGLWTLMTLQNWILDFGRPIAMVLYGVLDFVMHLILL